MKAVIQRVFESTVRVGHREIGAIGKGLMVLLGVTQGDTEKEAAWLAEKIINLRIFEDDLEKMNRSLLDTGGEMLVVSQFTLYGDCRKGRRPSFAHAADPGLAETLYCSFVEKVKIAGVQVATGQFRATMQVSLINDGPVTLIVETPGS